MEESSGTAILYALLELAVPGNVLAWIRYQTANDMVSQDLFGIDRAEDAEPLSLWIQRSDKFYPFIAWHNVK